MNLPSAPTGDLNGTGLALRRFAPGFLFDGVLEIGAHRVDLLMKQSVHAHTYRLHMAPDTKTLAI